MSLGELAPKLKGAKAKGGGGGGGSSSTYSKNDIRYYGALGLGEDNTAQINSLLAYCATTGQTALFAGLALTSSGGHTHDVSLFSVDGQGAWVNGASMASGTMWLMICTVPTGASLSIRHQAHSLRNVDFKGGTGTGLSIANSTSTPAVSGFYLQGVGFEYFTTGHVFGNNSYLIDFFGCSVSDCTTGIYAPAASNAGEKITYHGGLVGNCTTGLSLGNGNGDFYFFGTSFDNCTTYITVTAGKCELYGCHIEFNNGSSLTLPPITVSGSNTKLSINGSYVLSDSTLKCASVFTVGTGATININDGVSFANCLTTTNCLCSGVGTFNVNAPIQTSSSSNYFLGNTAGYSPLIDGVFTNSSFFDIWSITFDSAAITSRTVGTNLSMSITNAQPFNTNTNSLAVVKSGGHNTSAAVGVFVPAKSGFKHSMQGYFGASVTPGFTVTIQVFAGKIQYDINGVPSLQASTSLGTQTITPTLSQSLTISNISQASTAVVTSSSVAGSNPFTVGNVITFSGVTGMTQINGLVGSISAVGGSSGAWTATVNIDSTAFTAYASGGTTVNWTPFFIGAVNVARGYDTYLIAYTLTTLNAGTYYLGNVNVGQF